ncbi:hypothetical protein CLCR_09283 [Cladophialophora carrionii]|uniref:Uncharacterized protein n=1 Tax=Cladophialophora carrionii TaxID=86049 RepID=A0A1C1CRD7_9EURO|nr:hypothetical protein CLCR_09283 [Cladophialophora carrionii]
MPPTQTHPLPSPPLYRSPAILNLITRSHPVASRDSSQQTSTLPPNPLLTCGFLLYLAGFGSLPHRHDTEPELLARSQSLQQSIALDRNLFALSLRRSSSDTPIPLSLRLVAQWSIEYSDSTGA